MIDAMPNFTDQIMKHVDNQPTLQRWSFQSEQRPEKSAGRSARAGGQRGEKICGIWASGGATALCANTDHRDYRLSGHCQHCDLVTVCARHGACRNLGPFP
jgi:hypothetical protein